MNTGLYKSMVSADAPLKEPGYNKAYISLLSDFTTLNEPVIDATPALGEAVTIGSNHTWAVGKGPIEVLVDNRTLEVTGQTTGTYGSLRMNYAPKIFIKGDGPKVLEMINNLLNEELVLFVQDGCGNAQFLQFGCDCSPAVVEKGAFASGTLKGSNAKGYELTLDAMCKYFYNGTITKR